MKRLYRAYIQGESVRWHCAARREIAERSEEAPAAIAAQRYYIHDGEGCLPGYTLNTLRLTNSPGDSMLLCSMNNPSLALRGAEGDHRAQRGSSRSRSRAALLRP